MQVSDFSPRIFYLFMESAMCYVLFHNLKEIALDNTVGKVFALNMGDLGFIPGTP